MGSDKFIEICENEVLNYLNNELDKTDNIIVSKKDVFVVWSCKTLQNNKAMLSTTLSDGLYYEFTYIGDKKELYIDVYKNGKTYVLRRYKNELRRRI